jgi:hypothetical protein
MQVPGGAFFVSADTGLQSEGLGWGIQGIVVNIAPTYRAGAKRYLIRCALWAGYGSVRQGIARQGVATRGKGSDPYLR